MKKKFSKRYKKLVDINKDSKSTNIDEAITKVKNNCTTKFDESIDVSLLLNLKQKKEELSLRTIVNLPNGNGVNDTYFAITEICDELHKSNIIPILIGGSHDMIYPIYKSYSLRNKLTNIISIDNQFDFSQGGLIWVKL